MENQKLSNEVRENIVDIMNQMKINGEFENQPEHEMYFNTCSDDELIYYRDEWIVHVMEFDDKEYVTYLQAYLYNEDVFEYWNIKKENIK